MAELVASGNKRKLDTKTILEKYKILKEVDQGTSCRVLRLQENIALRSKPYPIGLKIKARFIQQLKQTAHRRNARD